MARSSAMAMLKLGEEDPTSGQRIGADRGIPAPRETPHHVARGIKCTGTAQLSGAPPKAALQPKGVKLRPLDAQSVDRRTYSWKSLTRSRGGARRELYGSSAWRGCGLTGRRVIISTAHEVEELLGKEDGGTDIRVGLRRSTRRQQVQTVRDVGAQAGSQTTATEALALNTGDGRRGTPTSPTRPRA